MKRLVALVILVPLAIVIVALSVANRHPVVLSADPFNAASPAVSIAMPLYVLLFLTLALGVFIGGVATWLGQGRWRRQARNLKRETKTIRRENDQFRAASTASPATTLPVPRRELA